MSKQYYTLIAFACVNIVCSSFIVFTYIAWKAGRKSPGDIVLALCICSLSTSIYWMMS
jgi:1-phosphatidylinositol-4-phosphate 5-kinase